MTEHKIWEVFRTTFPEWAESSVRYFRDGPNAIRIDMGKKFGWLIFECYGTGNWRLRTDKFLD